VNQTAECVMKFLTKWQAIWLPGR